jgi:RNA polymerase sigma-70 factor (ECF subfamily)
MTLPIPRPETLAPGSSVRVSSEPHRPPGIEELFRRHAPAVASLGLAMLHSAEEADDLVQDVFLRAWRAIDRLEDPEGARPWLMTIAVRCARTRLRRRKLSQLLFRLDEPDFDEVPSPGLLPEHR